MDSAIITILLISGCIVFIGYIELLILINLHKESSKNEKEMKSDDKIKQANPEIIKILLEEEYFKKVNNLIDSLITGASENYVVFALPANPNHYLTEKETEKMSKYIFGMVKKNLTENVLSVISTVYKLDTEKDIDDLIHLRIKLHIINFLLSKYLLGII